MFLYVIVQPSVGRVLPPAKIQLLDAKNGPPTLCREVKCCFYSFEQVRGLQVALFGNPKALQYVIACVGVD